MMFLRNLADTLISILRILVSSRWITTNSIGSTKNESVIVLGNGPSLKDSILEYGDIISRHQTIAVNLMVNSPLFEQIRPDYYMLLAPQFFMKDEELNEMYIANNVQLYEGLKSKPQWKMVLYVPYQYRQTARLTDAMKANANLNVVHFNATPIEGFEGFCHFCFARGLGMPRPHNVLIPSIMKMINAGFGTIFIIGADHSWFSEITVNEQNEALIHLKHFYDENQTKPAKMVDYIHRPRRLHEMLHKLYLTFKGYWDIKSFADSRHVRIYNASAVSMIDAFERKKLS